MLAKVVFAFWLAAASAAAPVALRELLPEEAEEVQRALQERGHYAGPIDGVVGPNTQAAFERFQREAGLVATGRLDTETLDALDLELPRLESRGAEAEPAATPQMDRHHVRPRDDGK